ncbi:hypothetical protein ABZU76_19645 [Amycolatopsis sp. NPDC005232]|uniref:hypothetical protein n=1 Tax=Amycolatopsis sp. NPDC005232 TaxID=3157027 RepID=UPI0033A9E655
MIDLGGNQSIVLDKRCHVLAGFNGAGKSETLARIAEALGNSSQIIRLHEICEQVRAVLQSRTDIEDMETEVGSLPIPDDVIESICSVVGRDYESVEWFNLELEPSAGSFPNWPWLNDDQSIVPHFKVEQDGISYGSTQMGLGEFSVHLLFWILRQLESGPGTLLLLDEPDAYLPPRTRMRFLAHLLNLARKQEWQLVLSSHAEQLISAAHEHDALVVLVRHAGEVSWYRSTEHGAELIQDLVHNSAADLILFCEDESAAALTRAILRNQAPDLADRTAVLWKDGDGYLRKLAQHLPRTSASPVKFSLVFDGDQEARIASLAERDLGRWPVLTLPTGVSPDELFRQVKNVPSELASALGTTEALLSVALSALAGSEGHDWVNEIARRFGPRTSALNALATLWVSRNEDAAVEFCAKLRSGLGLPIRSAREQ